MKTEELVIDMNNLYVQGLTTSCLKRQAVVFLQKTV